MNPAASHRHHATAKGCKTAGSAYVGSNPTKGRYVTDANSNVTGVTGADEAPTANER
jgi:hypothetical protein